MIGSDWFDQWETANRKLSLDEPMDQLWQGPDLQMDQLWQGPDLQM